MLRNKVPVLFLFAALHLLMFSTAYAQVPKKIKTIIVDAGHGGTDAGAVGQYENSLRSKEKDITLAIAKKLVAELKRQLPDVNTIPTRTTDIFQNPREKAAIANENHGDLFLCIHADSGPLKTGHRQIGTRMVTKYKVTGRGRKKKKTSYQVEEAVYEYFKMPLTRNGTSVWIFAPHKTSAKIDAIMKDAGNFGPDVDGSDSTFVEPTSAEERALAMTKAKRYQERSDKLATFVNDEIDGTGRPALGVNQRQVGIWVLQATNMPAILVETGFINNPDDERYLNSEKGQQELAEAITAAVKRYKTLIENNNAATGGGTAAPEKPRDVKIIPPVFDNRPIKETKVIQVKSDKVKIELYDDGEIDKDIVSVSFNGSMVVESRTLAEKAYTFNVDLVPNKTNELVLYAENLGDIPPNTALMVITDGVNRYEVRLSADLKNNASIKFELKR